MKIDIPFYISTNNKHMRCLQVFIELFNKFTDSSDLTILGYNMPDFKLTSNCNFVSMGKQGPVEEWSTDLRKYFLKNAPEHFIYSTEDVFFYKDFNFDYINYLVKIMQSNKKIGRLQLAKIGEDYGDNISNNYHYRLRFLETIKVEKLNLEFDMHLLTNSNYTVNCQPSIWNKEFLMKYLIDGYTPWTFEIQGSSLARKDTKWHSILLDKQFPLFKEEGFYGSYELSKQWANQDKWLESLENNELKNIVKTWGDSEKLVIL